MPYGAESRSQRIRFALAVFGAIVPGLTVQAAINAGLNPDEARDAAPFVYSMPEGEVSLTGFHCGNINAPSTAAFAIDPNDIETPPTIGLELVLDGSLPSAGLASHAAPDEEIRNPLSARLSRIIVEDGSSLVDGGGTEEVSLPEASMSVADLVDRCRP